MAALARDGARDVVGYASTVGRDLDNVETDLRRYFRYRGETVELVRTPRHQLEDLEERGYLEGDCDDIATFTAAVTAALGYRSRFVAIRTRQEEPNFEHVFTEVWDGNEWRRFDITVDPGVIPPEAERMIEYV